MPIRCHPLRRIAAPHSLTKPPALRCYSLIRAACSRRGTFFSSDRIGPGIAASREEAMADFKARLSALA
jgi:hypothetical protein